MSWTGLSKRIHIPHQILWESPRFQPYLTQSIHVDAVTLKLRYHKGCATWIEVTAGRVVGIYAVPNIPGDKMVTKNHLTLGRLNIMDLLPGIMLRLVISIIISIVRGMPWWACWPTFIGQNGQCLTTFSMILHNLRQGVHSWRVLLSH